MQEEKKYSLEELKSIFPRMNFTFLEKSLIPKLLIMLQGRIVGGIVRDSLLGITTNDLDIATPYLPLQVVEILESEGFHPVATGIEYGTISLFFQDIKIEITSLRKDVKNFGRRAEVEFGGNWQEDSIRRDFTFNGLFLAVSETNNSEVYLYDYHSGIEDLKKGVVRFIGDYRLRIKEDYLRILRFIRFFIRYSTLLDYPQVEREMPEFRQLVQEMNLLSMERVLMELQSILKATNWKLGIEMMNYFHISQLFFKTSLYISTATISSEEQTRRIIYALHIIDEKTLNSLPLPKELRSMVIFYKRFVSEQSIENIYYIWNKAKTLSMVNFILSLYKEEESKTLTFNINNTDKDFEIFRKNIPLQHSFGPERGLEEKSIKMEFIRQFILK